MAIAAASGYSSGDLLYVQVLLGDIGNYGDINDWRQRQFPTRRWRCPATFQTGALPFGAKIELQAVAAPLTVHATARWGVPRGTGP